MARKCQTEKVLAIDTRNALAWHFTESVLLKLAACSQPPSTNGIPVVALPLDPPALFESFYFDAHHLSCSLSLPTLRGD